MSKTPKRTLAAVTGAGVKICGITVRECTLGLSAILEKINSPLVDGRKVERLGDMLPTIFVMTRPAAESAAILAEGVAALESAAIAWADALSNDTGFKLAKACAASASRASAVCPQGVPGQDAGNGRAAGTAG